MIPHKTEAIGNENFSPLNNPFLDRGLLIATSPE